MPNAKVLESKKAVVEALTGKIQESTSVVFVDYKGISVAQDTELRKQFREAGVEYTVVKNTLTNFAAKNAGYDFSNVLNGTTAMASTTGDPIAGGGSHSGSTCPSRAASSKAVFCPASSSAALASCPARMHWLHPSWVLSWHLSPAWPSSWIRSGCRRTAPLLQMQKLNFVNPTNKIIYNTYF